MHRPCARFPWIGLTLVVACSSGSGGGGNGAPLEDGSAGAEAEAEAEEGADSREEAGDACPEGWSGCGGECFDLTSDIDHCGNCSVQCSPERREACIEGLCAIPFEQSTVFTVRSDNPETLTQFQVLLTLTPENFDYAAVSESGADIRFSTDGIQADVPYWIERWEPGGESLIWLAVPEIPAQGSVDVHLLSGNDDVDSASNGEAVFDFFDDLATGEVTDKWQVYGIESAEYVNGRLVFNSTTLDWGSASIALILEGAFVIHHSYFVSGQGGLAVGETPEANRYLFDVGSGADTTRLGTSYFLTFPGTREGEDTTYPAIPSATNGGVQDYVATVRVTDGFLDVIDYCNLTADVCAGPRVIEHFEDFGPFRFGLMYVQGRLVVERYFIRKYADPAPTIE